MFWTSTLLRSYCETCQKKPVRISLDNSFIDVFLNLYPEIFDLDSLTVLNILKVVSYFPKVLKIPGHVQMCTKMYWAQRCHYLESLF